MKNFIPVILFIVSLQANAQVVSKFTWSTTPLTNAVSGPNGTSISTSATAQNIGGSIGWALNPGVPTANIDLVIPGSPSFDINSIDLTLNYRREESVASFFKRGANFDFGSNGGNLSVKFTTTRGSTPGDTTINAGNIVAIADDHTFHLYRFRYDNNTGVANAWVDGTLVYTYNGVAGRPLSWTGAGNVIIGENMDATSRNIAVLANVTVQIANSTLPLNAVSFEAAEKNGKSLLTWKKSTDVSISHFVVERSSDNITFQPVSLINATSEEVYHYNDESPLSGINYYRLKIVDLQGKAIFSSIRQLNFTSGIVQLKCYPNPANDFVMVDISGANGSAMNYSILNLQGLILKSGSLYLPGGNQQVRISLDKSLTANTYVLRMHNQESGSTKSVVFLKK